MSCKEIIVKEALHKLSRRGLPYEYDLNIYRGCSHNCKYCYAVKSHKYLGDIDFNKDIVVKTNIAEALDEQLSKNILKKTINLGGVCDSYQHIEKDYKLMRDVLKVLIKHKNPIVVSTKSNLITRDLDLYEELAYYTDVYIGICITSCDEILSKTIEKGASLPLERFNALKEVAKTKSITGLHVMPILPFLADDEKTLENLVMYAKNAKVNYMLTGILYLTGEIKRRYLNYIKQYYPKHLISYQHLYKNGSADKKYKTRIHTTLKEARRKYGVKSLNEFYLAKK